MAITEPRSGLGITHTFGLGTNNWHTEMDANLKKLGLFGIHCAVLDRDLATPPGSPSNGDAYIVATSPTGAWTGHTGHIAVWDTSPTTPAWAFGTPREGWLCYIADEDVLCAYNGSAWVIGTGADANTIENGKTGATTAAGARTSLGLALADKGTIRVGTGSEATGAFTAGNDKDLIEYDSTQTTGLAKVTPRTIFNRERAWYAMASLALDFSNGVNQRKTLASGVNAFTGMANAASGTTYLLKLIQPASGAAGTVTFTPTSPNVVKANSLTLSPTNGKTNYVWLTFDSTGDGEFSAFVSGDF